MYRWLNFVVEIGMGIDIVNSRLDSDYLEKLTAVVVVVLIYFLGF